MQQVKNAGVAGSFYPADHDQLHDVVARYLAEARPSSAVPKALIVPHAGYDYSGAVAAAAYAHLAARSDMVRRVVLLGPAHYGVFPGLALSSADWWETPLGAVPVDKQARMHVLGFSQVQIRDEMFEGEHSLEVHLPFLQQVLSDFKVVPLLVGEATPQEVAEPLRAIWSCDETVVVVSSDLSHFHDYDTARELDRQTSVAIEKLRAEDVGPEQACGCRAIDGLLHLAREKGLKARTVDLRNSGDVTGSRRKVVGYGAFILE